MNAARQLHDLGQRLWPDNIARAILNSGTLPRHINECAVTGLTSNPTVFDHAISDGDAGAVIAEFARAGIDDAALASELQRGGTEAFARSWRDLLNRIDAQVAVLPKVEQA